VNSISDKFGVEVYQEPQSFAGKPKVCQHLGGMNRLQDFNGFQFADDQAFREDIQPVSLLEDNFIVSNGEWHLPFECDPPFS